VKINPVKIDVCRFCIAGKHCLIDKTDWIKIYDGGFVDQPDCAGRRPADASGKARKLS